MMALSACVGSSSGGEEEPIKTMGGITDSMFSSAMSTVKFKLNLQLMGGIQGLEERAQEEKQTKPEGGIFYKTAGPKSHLQW